MLSQRTKFNPANECWFHKIEHNLTLNMIHSRKFEWDMEYCLSQQELSEYKLSHLLREMSSCSGCWVVGWRTHFPLSISTRTSSSKSMFLSVVGPLKPRPAGVLGQRSLNSWLTAENPEDFLWEAWLRRKEERDCLVNAGNHLASFRVEKTNHKRKA